MNAYSFEKIKYFIEVESNSGCKLITSSWKNLNKEKLEIECKCGRIFHMFFYVFRRGRMGCPICYSCRGKSYEFSDIDIKDIVDLYLSGHCVDFIRKKYHVRNTKISEILKSRGINIKRTYEYYSSKELARTRKYYCKEDIFENIDSHDKSYWLGFLFADGNIYTPKGKDGGNKGIRIELCLKEEDYYHLHNFSVFLESNYPVKPKLVKLNEKEILVYRISIGSVKMGKDLISHGCIPNKSLILEYPKDLSDEYFPSFLCGYFDGDGCLSFIKRGKTSSSNQLSLMGTASFLQTIKEKLLDAGIETGAIYNAGRESKAYVLPIRANSHACFFNLIYHKASYMLGRKFDKFMDMLDYRGKDFEMSEVAKLARYIY